MLQHPVQAEDFFAFSWIVEIVALPVQINRRGLFAVKPAPRIKSVASFFQQSQRSTFDIFDSLTLVAISFLPIRHNYSTHKNTKKLGKHAQFLQKKGKSPPTTSIFSFSCKNMNIFEENLQLIQQRRSCHAFLTLQRHLTSLSLFL